ncbi:diacylglycerol kinase family protein [Pseudotenacibaculum sp. MALMAid0570]|uniref:diacylglycerol kinase family protein n=1 Tax=Pseudotenacibaculum sp. MALMAid0570 TaxID=3143938 RepID=UPI0032DEAFF8
MKNSKDNFLIERLKSIKFSLKGIWLLITTESSIKIQVVIALLAIIAGFYFKISAVEWLIQIMVIGLVLVAESLNTGIEKLSDFVHPDYHKKIGFIKDVSAGAAGIAAIISLIIAGIIYFPKIASLF